MVAKGPSELRRCCWQRVLATTFVPKLWTTVQSITVRSIWYLHPLVWLVPVGTVEGLHLVHRECKTTFILFCLAASHQTVCKSPPLPFWTIHSRAWEDFCPWFSEVSSPFPELGSRWRCARHLPKEFVASYTALELRFRDWFFNLLDCVITPSIVECELPSAQIVINQRTKSTEWGAGNCAGELAASV